MAGLLVGAALALVWTPWSLPLRSVRRLPAIALNLAGVGALAALVVLHLRLEQYETLLYRGGFALVAISSAAAIAVAVHPRAHLGLVLGVSPLRWLGTRSYAVYLWHWPVFMLTRPNVDVSIDGTELLALRFAITFALAELSYRLVERPVRSGALGRAWRAYRDGRGLSRWAGGVRWGTPVGAAASAAAVLTVFAIAADPPAPPPYLSVEAVNIVSPVLEGAGAGTAALPATQGEAAGVAAPGSSGTAPGGPPGTPGYGRATGILVTALGDSVMVGAAPELARAIPGAEVNAAVGRQADAALEILRQRSSAGTLGDAVVLHIGNNGTFTSGQFDAMMKALADRRVVIFVNIRVPRPWEEWNNGVISGGVKRYGNAALVDWHGATKDRPDVFQDDGIHLQAEGIRLYTALITQELAKHPPPPTPGPTPAEAVLSSEVAAQGDAPPPAGDPSAAESPPPADGPRPTPAPTPRPSPPTPSPEPDPPPPSPPPPPPPPPPDPTPEPPPPPPPPPPTPEPTPEPTSTPTPEPTPPPEPPPTPEPPPGG